ISGTELFICNDYGNLCPEGIPGELYIGGKQVSIGYLNRPGLNKTSFVRTPWYNGTLYRSGDIVSLLPDGNIHFIGRNDDQLKIRGFRIELGELESNANQMEGVTNVKALPVAEGGQKELALYFTSVKDISRDEYREFLSKKLPEYLLPKYVVRMDRFPLNKNGKIDSNSFPIPDMQQNKPETLFSPSGKTESTLIKIFKEILDCNTITAKDNFFNLGGHSLKAIRAVSAIRKELKTAITLKEFFSNPDIKSLGEIIKDKKREELGNIPVTEESEYYELSFAQKRLWVLDKIEKLKSTYNIPVAVRVKEEIDIPAMERSYRDLLTKHESLRSVFVQIDGEPRQKAVNDKEAPIILNDFSNTEDPEKGAFVYISSDAERAFDLSGYPLIRFYIIKISPADYVLFLNIHHIICDGWSLGVITEELFGGYQNYLKHSFNPVIPLKIQYRDYSQWQNNSIKAGSHNSDRDYWLERLGGEISPVEIPADFLRPAVKSYDGDSIYYSFSGDFKKRLDDFNSKRHCSLFMTLNAVLKVLLHRYSGKTDIIIGTPVAGRDHPDLESQVGNYVNMLALRDTLDPDISFARLLEQVKESSAEGFSHQMYPFDKLVEELRLPRDTSRSPLFDIVLVLQNFDIDPSRCFTSAEPYQVPVNISKYDITFNFNDKAKELDLLIEYNTRLFRKERVQLIASHLKVLLEKLLEDPSCIISKVNIPDKEEEKDLLTGYNNTAADYPDKETIISLFEKSAREYAGRTALVYKDKKLTYNQLNTHADSLSRFIRCNYTPGTGEVTGVFLSPSENTVIALLAVLKAGGAYLPLDPEYPDERISHILSESRIKIALTTAPLKERLQRIAKQAGCDCVILDIEKADKASATIPSPSSSPAVLPDTTAYVIFTSGSTGKPKGCQISHRNLVRLFFNDRNHFDFGPEDVWIMAHSFCFDFSVWEMYGALLYGGKLIIPERSEVRDISAFVKIVSGQKVTVLNQTPGAFYKFSEYLTGSREEVPLNLRYVIFGGDKLDPSKLGEWIKIHPASAISLVNMYGITETTIHVTYHKLTGSEIISSTGSSNIGKPLPETKVYILDEHKMLVPKGIYGEIYVGGSGVCKGYLNRPELTSERFIQNPYNDQEILYKSGDIGRWLCDGTLEYLDRSDNQVQIRGFRVEMAEIEMRLRSMDGITDVAVIAVDREGTKELAAYLVSEKEQKVNELKGFLSASLPEYMIPAYFIRTDKIPLTSNGKLDKKNLPPAIQNIATGVEFENPENDVESVLLKIWQTVLSTENISIRDNFFDIGGNSILLVRLHSKIDEVYPGILEITDLFSESTIAEQAHFIASRINPDKKEPIYGDEEKIRGHKSDGVAITGIALRIGSSQTPGEFWKELCNGSDLIGDLPESRKRDIEELAALYDNYRGTLNYRQYCYLNEVDKFDYGFFRLSPSEAALIDPGQRMFLETACHAIEDAGYGGDKLWGARTGIYIGASDNFSEYNRFIDSSGETDQNLLLTAQTPSILASRLSYFLNLKGPAMLVDTACSSSLVALHLACQAIREGKIDSALVGGVKLHLLPLDSGSRSGIDSSDSRAHCFDDSADGTGGGEGVIAIFVKSLEKALEENDNIYAVIRGSEINQDGSTIGITAPDADAQADVIDKAWKDAGIDPLTVSFIETHGTATKLGDPVEIEGITRAFRKHTAEKSFCAIGAIKANIGHLDTAAGLAGVVKAALSLSNRKLTPLVHFNTPNRNIRFEESPVYINKELTDWISNGTPLRCGVSSFGLSGTNCHVVMEEAPQRPKGVNKVTTGNNLFVLSARSEQILERYLAKIRETLIEKRNIDPRNLCYTLATGRGHHSCRTAVIFDTVEELVQKLERGETEVKCVKIASPARINLQGEEIKDPLKVAEAYLNGAEILWEDYFAARYSPDNFPSRISLPGYPFEKSRCWVKLRDRKQVEKSSAYGRNYNNLFLNECIAETPTLSLYKLNIQGNSWLVDEHRLMGTPTMVGTTYLQIAYEAGKIHFNSGNLLIEELYLLKPLVLSHSLQEVILSVNKNPDGSINAEVQSREGENIWHTYARFCVRPASEKEYQNPDIERVIKNCSLHKVTTAESREADKDNPVETSDKWNISADIHWNDNESVARLEIPAQDSPAAGSFWLYPPLTDAALSYALDEPGYVPFSFGTVRIISKMPDSVYSYVKKLPEESGGTRRYDIDITDTSGNTVVQFRGFTFKKVVLQSVQKFYELGWRAFKPQFPELPGFVNAALIYNSKCNPLLVDKIGQTPGIKGYCID
ncbi:MAG: amino acid adenylation domain-containing protein, partial [Bacteroidales bacterium]|nr:amino acid adenylation domain-containing protein [Bacteroidales bacterium]